MNILIIENEIYLAQSISARLLELEHNCDICISIDEDNKDIDYDIVLLSTNINGQDFSSVIKKYENAIILLMVSYVSNHTVSMPLDLGAMDYLIKPFMIDDLIKKIDHYVDYKIQKQKLDTYEKYLSSTFQKTKITFETDETEFPLFVFSNSQKDSDNFAFKYAFKNKLLLDFLIVSDKKMPQSLDVQENSLMYIKGFESLKDENKNLLFELIKDKNVIIQNNKGIEITGYKTY